MKNILMNIRIYLLKFLTPKKIIALQLEGVILKNELIKTISMDYSTGYNCISVHYQENPGIDHKFYDDREMLLRDFMFIAEILKNQKTEKVRKIK